MSTPNCPNSLSADAILESLERVARVVYYGQPLDSIISLALTEMRLLLQSDRILLGQRIVEAEISELSRRHFVPVMPCGNTGGSSTFPDSSTVKAQKQEGSAKSPSSSQEDILVQDHRRPDYTVSSISIQISHESLAPTVVSCLHQILALEDEWSKCPHIWHETMIVIPLWIDQQMWGTLMVQRFPRFAQEDSSSLGTQKHRFIDSRQELGSELQLIQGMATQLAIAIQQSQLRQALQIQTDTEEQLNHLKEEFLSTISHELRTPMASIKMATEMMDRLLQYATVQPDLQQQLQNYVQILQNETDREIQLINDLLDISRLEANAEPILLNTIDFHVWLPYIVNLVQAGITQAGLQLQCTIDDHLPLLKTDLSYLEGILGELLHNARKYTPPGNTITIEVSTLSPHTPLHSLVLQTHGSTSVPCPTTPPYPSQRLNSLSRRTHATLFTDRFKTIADANESIFSIAVRNFGVTIPPLEYERIFDKFYRIPSTDPWKHPGTGLGLALLKCRVHAIKGLVSVNSDQTATVFTVLLPNLQQGS